MGNTKELKDVVKLVADGIKVGVDSFSDGHLGLDDLPKIITLVPDVLAALNGITDVPAELAAMTPADADDLVAFIESGIPIGARAKELAEAALKVVYALWNLAKVIKAPTPPPSTL